MSGQDDFVALSHEIDSSLSDQYVRTFSQKDYADRKASGMVLIFTACVAMVATSITAHSTDYAALEKTYEKAAKDKQGVALVENATPAHPEVSGRIDFAKVAAEKQAALKAQVETDSSQLDEKIGGAAVLGVLGTVVLLRNKKPNFDVKPG